MNSPLALGRTTQWRIKLNAGGFVQLVHWKHIWNLPANLLFAAFQIKSKTKFYINTTAMYSCDFDYKKQISLKNRYVVIPLEI